MIAGSPGRRASRVVFGRRHHPSHQSKVTNGLAQHLACFLDRELIVDHGPALPHPTRHAAAEGPNYSALVDIACQELELIEITSHDHEFRLFGKDSECLDIDLVL